MGKPLIDIKDLAVELKLSPKTIRNKLSNRSWPIPPIRIGRSLRWRPEDVTSALLHLAENAERASSRQLSTKKSG
jgi:predicted DNA-binding transcriptional regulator AlpA